MSETTGAEPRRRSTAVVFWWSFAALFSVFVAWAVANPLGAAPDEPAHANKAAAVVHGQLGAATYDPTLPGLGVRVPAVVAYTNSAVRCFMFRSDVTAACLGPFPETADPAATATSVSTATRYNPLYYAVVGLPSLAPTGPETIYLMRLVSAALCALTLAWAFAQALTGRRGDWASLGVLLSMTPMVVYLSGTINPASLEIAGAAALWVTLLALVREADPARLRSRFIGLALIASVFVNLRSLSPLFLLIIVGTVVLSAPFARSWDVLRQRVTWPWIGLIGLATIAGLAWTRTAGTVAGDGVVHHPDLDFVTAAGWSLGDTSVYVTNMIGQFGWVDTNLPTMLAMLIAATIGFLVIVALAVGTWRERIALTLLAGLTVALPVVIHASQARYIGIVWQGRYFLPAAVGIPIVAAFVLSRVAGTTGHGLARRATILLGGSWWISQVIAFAINLHRYQNGALHGWLNPPADQWHPPVPVPLLYLVLFAGLSGLVALGIVLVRQPPTVAVAPPPEGNDGAETASAAVTAPVS
jgi:hypothetical protein